MIKCSKCGAELSDDAKFCSYCGNKIEATTPPPIEANATTLNTPQNDPVKLNAEKSDAPKSVADKIKDKASKKWQKLSTYDKITTVAIIVLGLLCLVAFLFGKTAAGIIAILQIVLTVVAVLLKKQIIKASKSWLHIIAFVLAIILLVPYVSLFSRNYGNAKKFAWSDILLTDVVPKPKPLFGEVISNHDDYLALYVYKTTLSDYDEYVEACKKKGFTVEADQSEQSYYAYNADGYKLSLYYDERDSKMHIGVDAAEQYGALVWSDSAIASMLPVPSSTTGKITQNDEKGFRSYVSNTPINEFKTYAVACADIGFNIDSYDSDESYSAENSEGYKLSVLYQGNNVISISVDEPEYEISVEVECVENLLFSKYDVDVYIDGSLEETIKHGATETFSRTMAKGAYEIKFVSADDDNITGTATIDIQKDELLKYKISCTSSDIHVETIAGTSSGSEQSGGPKESTPPEKVDTPNITVTLSEDDFKGMNYQEAEKIFREMGFTKFEYRSVDTETESVADTICYIEITEWFIGNSDFVKDDKFDADSTVTFFSYKYEAPEAPSPVFYSTNDYETAKKGNTGVFSYRDRGSSYDIYWIIDFGEGYVYYFTDGNSESSCDRLKIDSGTLNDNITITYHDGGDTWSYKLHFKYVDHPETLIMVDHNGFDWEYSTTDLDDALSLRSAKTIKDY